MKPFSMDFRVAVATARDNGMETAEAVETFGCCGSWVRRLMQRRRERGTLAPLPRKLPNQRKIKDEDERRLREFLQKQPDATLAEMIEDLELKVHPGTLCRRLTALDLPRKKKSRHASEQDRPDVKAARTHWFEQFLDVPLDQFVFLDEFGAATNMTRTHARAPRGRRAVCKVPHGHWKVLSTVAAMTVRGILCSASFEGAIDGELFLIFVREALVPSLRPGQIVVLDNLGAHKTAAVRRLVEAAGCRLLPLPPYSPDFNPIENAISKVKSVLRSLAERTVDGLHEAIGTALASITPADAAAFIRHCGYAAI
jgi:transposase